MNGVIVGLLYLNWQKKIPVIIFVEDWHLYITCVWNRECSLIVMPLEAKVLIVLLRKNRERTDVLEQPKLKASPASATLLM